MKKIFTAIFIFLCFSISVFAIDKIDEFWNLCDTNNYEEIDAYLTDWEKSNKKDPELYLAYSTYYFERSTQVSLEFTDEFAKKSEEYLNKGISYNPKRLDLQFKRVSFYSLKHDYKKEYDLLINLLSLDKSFSTLISGLSLILIQGVPSVNPQLAVLSHCIGHLALSLAPLFKILILAL